MPQSSQGQIELFYDFFGEDNIAETAAHRNLGPFSIGGQGSEATDAGDHTERAASSATCATYQPTCCSTNPAHRAANPATTETDPADARTEPAAHAPDAAADAV